MENFPCAMCHNLKPLKHMNLMAYIKSHVFVSYKTKKMKAYKCHHVSILRSSKWQNLGCHQNNLQISH